jgi:hypothetical protein
MKNTVLAGLLSLGATLPAQAESTAQIVACRQTVNDYAWYLDHPGDDMSATAQAFAQLFTEDAVLRLANARLEEETFTGHSEIAGRYLQGRDQMRFLHLMSNIRIQPTSDTTATGTNYVQIFIHPIGASMDDPRGVTGVAEYRDEYRFEDGVCRISNRYANLRLLSLQNIIQDPKP